MMKKWKSKRFLATVLASTMMLSLAACGDAKENSTGTSSTGGGSTGTSSAQAGSTDTGSTSVTAEENYDPLGAYDETLTLKFSRQSDGYPTYPEGVTNDNNGFVEYIMDKLNIKCETAFEADSNSGDYERQLSMAIASGELPDVTVIYGSNGSGKSLVKELYENDMIWDLTEVFENYASDGLKATFDSYPGNSAYELGSVDGNLVAIPNLAGLYYPMVWIRQDWVETLGLKLDEDGDGIITREELVETAKAFIKADFGGNGSTVGLGMTANMTGLTCSPVQIAHSFGSFMDSYMVAEDGTVYHGSTTEETRETLEWLAEMYKEGVIDPLFGARTQDDLKEMTINGQLGITFGPWHTPDWFQIYAYEKDSNAKFVAYNLDNGEGKVNYPVGALSDSFVVVSKECENPEAAIKIMNLINIHWNYLTPAEAKEECATLYEQQQAGMSLSARPICLDLKMVTAVYNEQILPALEYMDGTRTDKDSLGTTALRILEATEALEAGTFNQLDSTVWARYNSRMMGMMQCVNMTQNDRYETYTAVTGVTKTMEDSPVDLGGLQDETFAKIIVGELPIEAFDDYVKEWYAQGGATICEELAATLD